MALVNNSDSFLLLKETWNRFFAHTPKYFRVVGLINLSASAIGAIPDSLSLLDIALPPHWTIVVGRAVIAVGLWAKLQNKLVTSLPASNEMPLPFTEKKNTEQKQNI